MELVTQPEQSSESTVIEHHEFYLPAMAPKRVVAALHRLFAGLNRI